MCQRGISREDIIFIIQNGLFERAEMNRIRYWIPDSPFAVLKSKKFEGIRGTSVILSEDEAILTVYRNDRVSLGRLEVK